MASGRLDPESKEHGTLSASAEETEPPVADGKPEFYQASSISSVSSDSRIQDGSIAVPNQCTDTGQVLEMEVSRAVDNSLSRHVTGVSVATNMTSDPAYEVDFEENDKGDPKNWPMWYRCIIIFFMSYSTMTVCVVHCQTSRKE